MTEAARRRTVFGSDAFEARLETHIRRIGAAVPPCFPEKTLRAVVLGGGYGKGEGGVCLDDGTETLFNDLDFFLVVDGLDRRGRDEARRRLEALSRSIEPDLGIDVDFSAPKTVSEWRRLPPAQMWVELRHGHEVVWGDPRVMDLCPEFDPARLPRSEGFRLLLNRGTGLLLARERLAAAPDPGPADVDFIARNIAKAGLGLGEAWLIFQGGFHPSYVERSRILETRREEPLVRRFGLDRLYAEALEYKLKPTRRVEAAELRRRLADTTERFLGFYAESGAARNREAVESSPLKNLALGLRDRLRRGVPLRRPFSYPRLRLFPVLPALLAAGGPGPDAARALGAPAGASVESVRLLYDRLWKAYN